MAAWPQDRPTSLASFYDKVYKDTETEEEAENLWADLLNGKPIKFPILK